MGIGSNVLNQILGAAGGGLQGLGAEKQAAKHDRQLRQRQEWEERNDRLNRVLRMDDLDQRRTESLPPALRALELAGPSGMDAEIKSQIRSPVQEALAKAAEIRSTARARRQQDETNHAQALELEGVRSQNRVELKGTPSASSSVVEAPSELDAMRVARNAVEAHGGDWQAAMRSMSTNPTDARRLYGVTERHFQAAASDWQNDKVQREKTRSDKPTPATLLESMKQEAGIVAPGTATPVPSGERPTSEVPQEYLDAAKSNPHYAAYLRGMGIPV